MDFNIAGIIIIVHFVLDFYAHVIHLNGVATFLISILVTDNPSILLPHLCLVFIEQRLSS